MHEKLFGGYSELQTHCLFLVLFFFFFLPTVYWIGDFLLRCMSQAETDWHLSLQDLWIFCSYKLQIIDMQSETWTPLREQKVRSVKYQEDLSYLFTA